MANKGQPISVLKPFKKGADPRRNLEGRPPVLPELKEILIQILAEEKEGKDGTKMNGLEMVLKVLHSKAVKGDIRAIQEILDRFYGKSAQTINANVNTAPQIIFQKASGEVIDK